MNFVYIEQQAAPVWDGTADVFEFVKEADSIIRVGDY